MEPCCGKQWCERHAMYKRADMVDLCRRDETLRAYLDKTAEERRKGLVGNQVEALLSKAGISKEWWVAFKEHLGFPGSCNCPKRQAWLNEMHALARSLTVKGR